MRPDSLFVIGLGPAGGSVAWGAVQGGVSRVVGYDRVRSDAVQALRAGAVHALADRLDDGLREAEMVVIASGGVDALGKCAGRLRAGAFVTSLAEVAAPLVAAAAAAGLTERWAASHPVRLPVGAGFEEARADAFREMMVAVTSSGAGSESAAHEVMHFWESVYEAEAVRMSVEEHDRRIAWMGQLPGLLAALHADALRRDELGAATVGGGAARLHELIPSEGSSPELIANRAALLDAIRVLDRSLEELQRLIQRGDATALAAFLARGRR